MYEKILEYAPAHETRLKIQTWEEKIHISREARKGGGRKGTKVKCTTR